MNERWILQFCHCHYGPFLDVARQYAALFKGSPYKVLTVYLTGEPSDAATNGSASDEVIFLNFRSKDVSGLKLAAIRALKKIVASRDFALIIAHRFKPIYIACLATKLPVIGVHHAFGDYRRAPRRWFANAFRKRLALLGVSNAVRDDIRQHLPSWAHERIETLHNRLDVAAVQAEIVSRETARDALGLPRDVPVIGNVGRLHPDKDQETLIKGFAVAREQLPTGSLLAIMGSGQLEASLRALAIDFGIMEHVHFLGQVPNGRRYFKAFDVFALTSDHEPFGMVLLEAMAAGVPVICSDCGGGPEVVRGTGRMFPLGDAATLAVALVQQIQSNPDELPLLRRRMQENLQLRFSDQAIMRQFWSLTSLSSFANTSATHAADSNPWREKAKALDVFRWMLLRERHGVLGSTVRFARDAIIDWHFGLQAKRRLARSIEYESYDFLLLQSAPRIIRLQRKKLLIDTLRHQGYRLIETALQDSRSIAADRLLAPPPYPTPLRYFSYAAHAAWIVRRYQPRVLLNDRNGSLYSPFLRLSLKEIQGTLVHLAHATTVESSRRLSMNDYDYYLLFGLSSLAALQARKLRFGTSTIALTGSHMIDQSYDMPPANPSTRTLLILGVGPDKEREPGYQRTYGLLREWASANSQYRVLVKRHPRSAVPFWHETSKMLENVHVLPTELSLAQALKQASLVANIMSNAVIEAGLASRPVIYCNLSNDRDIFSQEQFFGPAVTNPIELQSRILAMEDNFAFYVEKARIFANFHLAHGSRGLEKTVRTLQCLLERTKTPEEVENCVLPNSP